MPSDLRYWIGFNRTNGIGPVRLRALIQHFGSVDSAWNASEEALRAAHILDQRTIHSLLHTRTTCNLDVELSRLAASNINVVTIADTGYPAALRSILDAPPVLYIRGELPDDDTLLLAVVGTRSATNYGKQMATTLIKALVDRGVVIVSGIARGIDTIALQTVVEHGGRCIGVLPCGLDQVPSSESRKLIMMVSQNGALVSEYPLGVKTNRTHYYPRNRVISGLSAGVLVVEAGARSGALITADHALEQGRDVFAVPGNAVSAASLGTNALIQAGAKVVLSVDDILDELKPTSTQREYITQAKSRQQVALKAEIMTARKPSAPPLPPTGSPEEAKIVAALVAEPLYIDDIAIAVDLPMAQVSAALSMLAVKGLVEETGIQHYALVTR